MTIALILIIGSLLATGFVLGWIRGRESLKAEIAERARYNFWKAAWLLAIELHEYELLHQILGEVKSTREGVNKIMSQLTDLQQAVSDLNQSITDETQAITDESAVIAQAIAALGGANPDLAAITASLVTAKANIDTAKANVLKATSDLTAAVPVLPPPTP